MIGQLTLDSGEFGRVHPLLSVFNAPAENFVRTLNEIPAKFVRTLSAIAQAKEAG